MTVEITLGIHVTDQDEYQNYRDGMTPLLHEAGGEFIFDFKIAEVLKSPSDKHINRLFTIRFPDQKVMNDFFSSEAYNKVKATHFDISVESKTVVAFQEKA